MTVKNSATPIPSPWQSPHLSPQPSPYLTPLQSASQAEFNTSNTVPFVEEEGLDHFCLTSFSKINNFEGMSPLPPPAAPLLTTEASNEGTYYEINYLTEFDSRRQFQIETVVTLLLSAAIIGLKTSPYASIGKPTHYDYALGAVAGMFLKLVIDLTNPSVRPNWLGCLPHLDATDRRYAKMYALVSLYIGTLMAASLYTKGDDCARIFRLLVGSSIGFTFYNLFEMAPQRGLPRD